ncbi:MAG TPA: DUF2997 domain-containing protein [Aggregatilineales bacterium]|nr:DUF2997 domain-containing protein [Aggregatilineales bacterium]
MAQRQEIEFVIRPDGTVEEKVTGVGGPACEDVTRGIEQALGEIQHRERTAEYYRTTESASDEVTTSG